MGNYQKKINNLNAENCRGRNFCDSLSENYIAWYYTHGPWLAHT